VGRKERLHVRLFFSWVRIYFLRNMRFLFYICGECFICTNLFDMRLLFYHVSAQNFKYARYFVFG